MRFFYYARTMQGNSRLAESRGRAGRPFREILPALLFKRGYEGAPQPLPLNARVGLGLSVCISIILRFGDECRGSEATLTARLEDARNHQRFFSLSPAMFKDSL